MNFLYLNKEWKINCLASKCTRPTTRFHNCLGTAPHMQGSLNHLVIIVTWRMYFILSPRKCDYNLKNPYLRWRATLVAISPVGLIFWGKNQGPKCNGNQPEIFLLASLCQQILGEWDASKLCWTRCSCQEAEKVPSQLLPQAGDP